jgi:hypothetical protein
MMYLYRRGEGSKRRVMHLTPFDPRTGKPTMIPLCGIRMTFNTNINVTLSQPVCRRCSKLAAGAS